MRNVGYQLKLWVKPLGPAKLRFTILQRVSEVRMFLCGFEEFEAESWTLLWSNTGMEVCARRSNLQRGALINNLYDTEIDCGFIHGIWGINAIRTSQHRKPHYTCKYRSYSIILSLLPVEATFFGLSSRIPSSIFVVENKTTTLPDEVAPSPGSISHSIYFCNSPTKT